MSKQQDMELVIDFMMLNRIQLFNEMKKKYKSLTKGKSDKEIYGMLLSKVGYANSFVGADEATVAEEYLKLLVEGTIPLYDFERDIYMTIESTKRAMLPEIRLIEDASYFQGHSLLEDKYYKLLVTAKYIKDRFIYTTPWYKKFVNGDISGETLVEHIKNFINLEYDILVEDTNISYCLPRNFTVDKIKVYVPTSIDLSETTPIDFICSEVIQELNGERRNGISPENYKGIIDIIKKNRNPFSICENIEILFDLDVILRLYRFDSFKSLLEPEITLGTPFTLENTKTPNILIVGNYDETVTFYSGDISFTINQDSYGIVVALLGQYKLCSVNKTAAINKDNEKQLLWSFVYSNSKPADGNCNNITKQNVI